MTVNVILADSHMHLSTSPAKASYLARSPAKESFLASRPRSPVREGLMTSRPRSSSLYDAVYPRDSSFMDYGLSNNASAVLAQKRQLNEKKQKVKPSNVAKYAEAWQRWESWGQSRKYCVLPVNPVHFGRYLDYLHYELGLPSIVIVEMCNAVDYVHSLHGYDETVGTVYYTMFARRIAQFPTKESRPSSPGSSHSSGSLSRNSSADFVKEDVGEPAEPLLERVSAAC